MNTTLKKSALLTSLLCFSFVHSHADERLFTYSYEADVLPKGGLEFEQWITHQRDKEEGVFSRWDFREELEYGITDRLTTALYLNFRQTTEETASVDANDFEFKGISSEWKYQILNPNTKPLGVLAYGEVTYNGTEVELEQKLVLQKNFGEHWVTVFNATVEEEWEWEADETERELSLDLTAGVSYRINNNWAVGLEGRNHRVFPDFGDEEASAWFVGPAIHYGRPRWWATLTVLPQVAGDPDTAHGLELEEHTKIEARLIIGYNF